MKVDQYRIQKAKEYSFLVPSGTDLGDFDEPQKGWLNTFHPYVLEQQDVELEALAEGQDLATAIEYIESEGIVAVLFKPFPADAETNSDAID